MANGLDVVAVRTDDERAVVVCVVVRAQAGWAVVLATGGESLAVESINLPRVSAVNARCKALGLDSARESQSDGFPFFPKPTPYSPSMATLTPSGARAAKKKLLLAGRSETPKPT